MSAFLPTRPLGARAGVGVSELALGAAPLGETFEPIAEDRALYRRPLRGPAPERRT